MKKAIYGIGLTICFFTFSNSVSSQTSLFKVNGTVACESQIESLITNLKGVTSASWDASTKMITIIYDEKITHFKQFYIALTIGGFDNEGSNAKNEGYDALPPECKYKRESLIH